MKYIALFIFLISVLSSCTTHLDTSNKEATIIHQSPKLVVGIVVDQMRYDYLTRFYDQYGEGGFKRMIRAGYNCKNTHFNYVPTYTGPGHASIFTGTTPQSHGIIANYWYDKEVQKKVYCASDTTVQAIGTTSVLERMSPHRLQTTTIADQNRLHTQMQGKSIGIALKDRGAILPVGHTANAAYWFRGKEEGKWISSTFYQETLPDWVQQFNADTIAESYFKVWNTLHPMASYTASGADQNNFEEGYVGKEDAMFPYDLKVLKNRNEGYDIIKHSAFGNSLTTDFAIAAIEGEQLGKDAITDVLTLSFSSTDYVGHIFGVNSKEIQDTYLRLDADLTRLFTVLDAKVGKEEYTVFLTADHGAVQVPSYLKSLKIPAGYFDIEDFETRLKAYAKQQFKVDGIIANVSNTQVFFDDQVLTKAKLDPTQVEKIIARFILTQKKVAQVYTRSAFTSGTYTEGLAALLQRGYHQKRSGDVIFALDPAHIVYNSEISTITAASKGSTHGSGLSYDTHVPLLFMGKGIQKGSTLQKTAITDIAPTIAALLGIVAPNGTAGTILPFVLE